MAIKYNEEQKTFTLQTCKSTYKMKVDAHGMLLHTYFGPVTDDSDLSYLIAPDDHGFSAQVGEIVDDRTYSMDYFPLEYAVHGNSDFRISALRAGKEGSVPALDLRYHSHEIKPGKYALPGLPALFAAPGEEDVETLEITLKDAYEEIYVKLLYGVFEGKNVITRSAVIENRMETPMELHRAMSMSLDYMDEDLDLVHFYGKHVLERQLERRPLTHGITEIASVRGNSSHQHNPFVILCEKHTTEDQGGCWGYSLLYSGSFRIRVEYDQFDSTRIVCGISDNEFIWNLAKGESFVTPEVVLSYTPHGFTDLSSVLHKAYMDNLIRSPWKYKKRPALVNNWEATYFDFNALKLLTIAHHAADLGLDMLVLDDGWFGKRDDDKGGLGDWYVNERKLGCSLEDLASQINHMGLKFGIWVEPEMVNENSDLYKNHPEWVLEIPGRTPNRGRNQLVLDLSNREVVEFMKSSLDNIIDSANVEYIKWDMNRCVDNIYSTVNPSMSQGAIRHQYVLGLYEVQEHMLTRHPNLLLEGCNGGGGRFDAGMLYYAPQVWCSDNTDAIERLRIHYGTSFGYPMSAVGAHVSACPNHQNGRVVPFKTRGVCAMQGSFGYELDLSKLTEEEKAEAREQIQFYNENYDLIQQGTYYRLASPYENPDYTAWSYVASDQSRAILCAVHTDLHGNPKPRRLKLKGLSRDALYEVDGTTYTGAALVQGGLVLPKPACNYDSYMVSIRKCTK